MQAAKQKAAAARRAVEELMAAEDEEQQKAQARARRGNQQRAKAKHQSAKPPAEAQLTQALPPQAIEQGETEAQKQQAQQVQAMQTPPCEGAQSADADSAKAEAKRAKKQRQKAKKQSAQQQAASQQPAQSSVPHQASEAQQPELQQQQSARQPDAQQVDLAPALSTVNASRQTWSDAARKPSDEAAASLQGDDQSLMPQLPEADANAAYEPGSSEASPDPQRNRKSSPALGKQPTGVPAVAAALTRRAHDRFQLPLAASSTFPGVADPVAAAAPPGLGFEPTQQRPKGKGQSAVGSVLNPVTGSCQASHSPHVPAPKPCKAGPATDVAMTWQKQSGVGKPAVQPNMGGATKTLGQKPALPLPTASSSTEVLDGILTPYMAPAEHVDLLFQCPLTKVSAAIFWSLLASVQPDDMLLRCARLYM